MNLISKYATLTILIISFLGCKKKTNTDYQKLLGLEYYPVENGRFVEYDIDSTVYNDLTLTSVTYQYRIKEIFNGTFTDNEGRTAWRLERYIKKKHPTKPYDSIPYTIKEVWKCNPDNKKIELTEKNIPYIKLIFPIEKGATWNGHAKNTMGEQTFRYTDVDKSETLNGIFLPKVLTVEQKNSETLLSKDYYNEKYAKDIGLVYKEMISVFSNTLNPSVPLMNRISGGFVYKQTLVRYGKE